MKESALGLVPDLTGTKPLVERVGYARALEICATARMVERARRPCDIGLALDRAYPRRSSTPTVADLVGRPGRTDGGCGPRDQALLQGAADRDLEEQRRLEREAQVRRFRELAAAAG